MLKIDFPLDWSNGSSKEIHVDWALKSTYLVANQPPCHLPKQFSDKGTEILFAMSVSEELPSGAQLLLDNWFDADGGDVTIQKVCAAVVESWKLKACLPRVKETGVCYAGFRAEGKLPRKGHIHPVQIDAESPAACSC